MYANVALNYVHNILNIWASSEVQSISPVVDIDYNDLEMATIGLHDVVEMPKEKQLKTIKRVLVLPFQGTSGWADVGM